jgi:hypothetical protein
MADSAPPSRDSAAPSERGRPFCLHPGFRCAPPWAEVFCTLGAKDAYSQGLSRHAPSVEEAALAIIGTAPRAATKHRVNRAVRR